MKGVRMRMRRYEGDELYGLLRKNDAVLGALNDGFILLGMYKQIIYKNTSTDDILVSEYEWNILFDTFKKNIENGIPFTNEILIIKPNGSNLKERFVDVSYQIVTNGEEEYAGSYFLLRETTSAEKSRRKNDFISKHNTLTGLFNKKAFCTHAREFMLTNKQQAFSMILIDIDQFKIINELFGVEIGDKILCTVTAILREFVQNQGVIGHLDNDRFVALIATNSFNADKLIESLDEKLCVNSDSEYKVISHIGVFEISNYNKKIAIPTLIDKASLALVTVKGDMNKRVASYQPYMTKEILRQQKVIGEIDKALENHHICFYIQPQTDINGYSHGGEALVRWIDPDNGVVLPKDFIPILEEKGLISKVDLYVWDAVCQTLQEWKNNGWDKFYISVNISAKDMYYMDIYKEFVTLVEKYGIEPASLRLELTESAVMTNSNRNFETLEKLRDFGFVIEIDDFGSGYSSLNMLKDIAFDVLKIDMVFLRETENIEKSKEILKAIINMAKAIGSDIITEGVETLEQLEFLNSAGCNVFQGYYFDKPLPVKEFETKYLTIQEN